MDTGLSTITNLKSSDIIVTQARNSGARNRRALPPMKIEAATTKPNVRIGGFKRDQARITAIAICKQKAHPRDGAKVVSSNWGPTSIWTPYDRTQPKLLITCEYALRYR